MSADEHRELNRILGDASQAKKRAEGLNPDEIEAVLALVDWPAVANGNRDPLPKALPQAHLLNALLPRIDVGAPLGEQCLFDVPLETFTGLVGGLRLRGEQVLDAFRYLELCSAVASSGRRSRTSSRSWTSSPRSPGTRGPTRSTAQRCTSSARSVRCGSRPRSR